jgi:hypothetical protein
MLACNQNGVMGSLVFDASGLETWKTNKAGKVPEGWIGVFNRADAKTQVELTAEVLGFDAAGYELYDVWSDTKRQLGESVTLKPNGVLFIKFSI